MVVQPCLAFAACSFIAVSAAAQPSLTPPPSPQSPTPAPSPRPAYEDLLITAVRGTGPSPEGRRGEVGLGEVVVVEIQGLAEWAREAEVVPGLRPQGGAGRPNDPAKEVRDATPRLHELRADRLLFQLPAEPFPAGQEIPEVWQHVLGHPQGTTREVEVAVALPGRPAISHGGAPAPRLKIRLLDPAWLAVYVVLLVVALLAFFELAKRTAILRDGTVPRGQQPRPFSLGQTQMAFWFFLVIASYVFIWMVTGARDTLTTSVLALIGISAATALGATAIDASKDKNAEEERVRLESEVKSLQTAVARLEAELATAPAGHAAATASKKEELIQKKTEVKGKAERLQELAQASVPVSSGSFLTDILSDARGISFHRLQIALWTVVLGIIFVSSVYRSLAMPVFSGELLAAMGISGGTYLGFKYPEAKG
jgi:hypothetical protein